MSEQEIIDLKEQIKRYEKDLLAQKTLNATLHKGVCAGYAALLDEFRRVERELLALKEGK